MAKPTKTNKKTGSAMQAYSVGNAFFEAKMAKRRLDLAQTTYTV